MPKWMEIKAVTEVSGPLDRAGTTFVEVVYPFHRPRTEVLAAEPPVLHEMGGRSVRGISLVAAQIGYPVWAICLGRRWRANSNCGDLSRTP